MDAVVQFMHYGAMHWMRGTLAQFLAPPCWAWTARAVHQIGLPGCNLSPGIRLALTSPKLKPPKPEPTKISKLIFKFHELEDISKTNIVKYLHYTLKIANLFLSVRFS